MSVLDRSLCEDNDIIFVSIDYAIKRHRKLNPDSKVHGANMGPLWGRQDPGGPHVGPMKFAFWEIIVVINNCINVSIKLSRDFYIANMWW